MAKKTTTDHFVWIALFAIILAGCNNTITSPSPTASPTRLLESPTSLTTSTIPIAPTPTSTATPPHGEVEYHCINIGDDPTTLNALTGKIVLNGELIPHSEGKWLSNPSLLVDLQTGEQITLAPEDSPSMFVISPNGRYLAYDTKYGNDYTYMRINIVDSTNTPVGKFVEKSASFEWLNDEILFVHGQVRNNLIALYPFENKRIIIPPFETEKERKFPYDFQMLYDWGFYGSNKIIYNSTLTRAIYAARDGVIFHDLTTNQDIYTLKTGGDWGVSPKWSPDGTKLAISININLDFGWENRKYELVILDQNGKQLLMTNLSALPGLVYISSLSWSPDGGRIAFWYTTNDDLNTGLRLAVYDTSSQKVIDYCIVKNSDYFSGRGNDTSPIWSPDANFLLISKTDKPDNNPSAIIVDLNNERATVVKTEYEPVGWMK